MMVKAVKKTVASALFVATVVGAASACGLVEESASDEPPAVPDAGDHAAPSAPFDAISPELPDTSRPPPITCEADATVGRACDKPGATCVATDRCCECGDGFCPRTWACATPSRNDPSCPPTVPDRLSRCTVAPDVRCDYCAGGRPERWGCATARFFLECERTGNTECWYPGSVFSRCD